MSGFFQSLLARSRTDAGMVRPRIASIFEAPQASDPNPVEETSVVETSTRPARAPIERPVVHSVAIQASEPEAHAAAPPPIVPVEAVAAPLDQGRVSNKLPEPGFIRGKQQQPPLDLTSKRILSHPPSPATSVTEAAPASSNTREIRKTREVRDTIREQRTLVDRTFLERVAQSGRRSPQEHAANPISANPEPEIHVSIGRIEVRAVNEAPGARKTPQPPTPVMGLDEYLRHKAKGAGQ